MFFQEIEESPHNCTINKEKFMSYLPPLPATASVLQRFKRSLKKSTLISERNPQSTEYFRSLAEILHNRQEQVEANSCIIHPFSLFRTYYEIWMAFVLFTVMFYLPVDASFDFYAFGQWNASLADEAFRYVDSAVNVVLATDIIMIFCTGYADSKTKTIIMDPKKIAKHYIFGIFFITDVFACMPGELFVTDHKSKRLMQCFGLFKIVRLSTLFSYIARSAEFLKMKNTTMQITKNLLVTVAAFHWCACAEYLVPQIRYFAYGKISVRSWITVSKIHETGPWRAYIQSFYRASGYIFCVNFETIQLEVWEEKLLAIITFLFGKIFVFYFTVVILEIILMRSSLETKYFETISQVQSFMSLKQLPMHMQLRLIQYYRYKYKGRYFKESSITGLLSDKLKNEINLNVCSQLVKNVSLLAQLPKKKLEQIVALLKAEIYLPNDLIIKAGSVGDCMYFLASGTVAVWSPSGKEICHLQDGAYFGEITLVFKDKKRTAHIVAIEICEVYKLDRRLFKHCFRDNPELLKGLESLAKERLEITQLYEDMHAKACNVYNVFL